MEGFPAVAVPVCEGSDTMETSGTNALIGLDAIKEAVFRNAARRLVDEYRAHFGDRLVATYVWGSVHRGEAVPGVSDLDLFHFITDAMRPADQEWRLRLRRQLEGDEVALGGATGAHPVDILLANPSPALFRLRYDATLVWGRDLTEGLDIPTPDRWWAVMQFQSPWALTRYAAGIEPENKTDFRLPEDPSLRLRKLARLGVLGGACRLMALGRFYTYRGREVLPTLEALFPQWEPFLRETERRYIHPAAPGAEQVADYLSKLVVWMDWVGAQLQ
jgi:predicted nucleotidyltransferase